MSEALPSAAVWRTWSPEDRRLAVVAWVGAWMRAAGHPPLAVTVAGSPALPATVGVAVRVDPLNPGLVLAPALVWGDDPAAVWQTVAHATQQVLAAWGAPATAGAAGPPAGARAGATS